jgi:hypothetical protein
VVVIGGGIALVIAGAVPRVPPYCIRPTVERVEALWKTYAFRAWQTFSTEQINECDVAAINVGR